MFTIVNAEGRVIYRSDNRRQVTRLAPALKGTPCRDVLGTNQPIEP